LGFSGALLDLAKNSETVASALARIRCPQCVFAVSTLIDSVIVGKSLEQRSKFVITNC
jgi:hypothetical protein